MTVNIISSKALSEVLLNVRNLERARALLAALGFDTINTNKTERWIMMRLSGQSESTMLKIHVPQAAVSEALLGTITVNPGMDLSEAVSLIGNEVPNIEVVPIQSPDADGNLVKVVKEKISGLCVHLIQPQQS